MRSIKINFNAEKKLPDGDCLGMKGEHNATELNISLPEEFLNNDDVEGVVIVFQVGAHRAFRSDVHEKAELVSYKLPREVTCANKVDIQLEGYDLSEELIIKSEVIEGLYLKPSVCGEDTNEEVSKSLVGEIAANTFARHTHENSEVLNKFGEDTDGNLIYKGREIGSSRPTAQLEVFMDEETDFNIWFDTYGKFGRVFMIDFASRIPVGTEISSIEIAFPDENNGEYINIKDLYTLETSPYIILSDKVFYNPDFECLTYAYLLCFSPEFTTLLTKAIDYGWSKIRITYYTD